MLQRIRNTLAQSIFAGLMALCGLLLLSWPLLDIGVGDCSGALRSVVQLLQCQWTTIFYLFSVWVILISLLFVIALAARVPHSDSVEVPDRE